jgi:hypothetical protein
MSFKVLLPSSFSLLWDDDEASTGQGKYLAFTVFNFNFTEFVVTSPAAQLSPAELTEMRNELFNKEKNRQLSLTPRTEKIEVKHVGKTDPGTVFVMNKNISTPYSCAMRKSQNQNSLGCFTQALCKNCAEETRCCSCFPDFSSSFIYSLSF